jgi:hypothetical protein
VTSVIISCGQVKRDCPAPAADLYLGYLFRSALRWARSITADAHIVVLSAKYGLVPLATRLAPYDLRMGQPGSITAERLADQLHRYGMPQWLAVCGALYRRVLAVAATAAAVEVTYPFSYLPNGSVGYLRGALRSHHGRIPSKSGTLKIGGSR